MNFVNLSELKTRNKIILGIAGIAVAVIAAIILSIVLLNKNVGDVQRVNLKILGKFDSLEQLSSAHPTGDNSGFYEVGGVGYVWDGNGSEWLSETDLIMSDPEAAYQIAVLGGYTGTLEDWLRKVVGENSKGMYDEAVSGGYTGSYEDWISELVGAGLGGKNGSDGGDGADGNNGDSGILQEKIDGNKSDIDALQKQLDELQKKLNTADDDKTRAELEAAIKALQDELLAKTAEYERLIKELTVTYSTEVNILQQKITEINQSLSDGNSLSAEELAKLRAEKDALEGQLIGLQGDIEKAIAKLQNGLDDGAAELKKLGDDLSTRADGLDGSVAAIKKQLDANKKLLEESIKNGNTDLQKELEAKNAELQAQLDKNLAELQAKIDALNTKSGELQGQISANDAALKQAVADGDAQLTADLQAKSDELKKSLADENLLLKEEIATLQGRIKSMEDENRTVTIDPATKHWIVGGVDTGVVAEGINGRDG